ncbi:cytochrome P450 [Armillaria borealis]|uniref:Cytochrome P450 n=1 Tax=Armillaria borealis TaxID=47425 RepID=A0AA39K1I5_9AGAR|nr:cytochrome P450 [Armillaria borealis]
MRLPGAFFRTSWWNKGADFHWARRFDLYKTGENVSIVPWLTGDPGIFTSNLDVARQVVSGSHKTDFKKGAFGTGLCCEMWGMNLFAADGDVWRKHRRVVGPVFNNKLYKSVWNQTQMTYNEMLLTLSVIAVCGFGFSIAWDEPEISEDGSMSVQEALRIVTDNSALAFAPKWVAVSVTSGFSFRDYRMGQEQLSKFLKEQVIRRRAAILHDEIDASKSDTVFDLLIKARENEEGKYSMNSEELIGNAFIMLFAGHETAAQSLAATLGFLAVHDEIQEEVYQEIKSVLSDHPDPRFEDHTKLEKVLAVFYEALRMFPPGHVLIREAAKDTVINVPKPVGQEGTIPIPIPKGFQVMVDMVGIQYNPRYFDEPEKYKPSRWYGTSNESDSFTAFSIACIGRKFATTQAVCFLTLLLRDWMVKPILRDGETKEAWANRVLDASIVITLGVRDVPLTFSRRCDVRS